MFELVLDGLKRKRRRDSRKLLDSYNLCCLVRDPQTIQLTQGTEFDSSQQIAKLKPENTLDKGLSDECWELCADQLSLRLASSAFHYSLMTNGEWMEGMSGVIAVRLRVGLVINLQDATLDSLRPVAALVSLSFRHML